MDKRFLANALSGILERARLEHADGRPVRLSAHDLDQIEYAVRVLGELGEADRSPLDDTDGSARSDEAATESESEVRIEGVDSYAPPEREDTAMPPESPEIGDTSEATVGEELSGIFRDAYSRDAYGYDDPTSPVAGTPTPTVPAVAGAEAVLCLDFGTSFSKAAIVDANWDLSGEVQLLQLGENRSFVSSAMFVSDDGMILFGDDALRFHAELGKSSQRDIIDSPKPYLTFKGNADTLRNRYLDKATDPLGRLSVRDALVLYLAFQNALCDARTDGRTRTMRRRFTHPFWSADVRQGKIELMERLLAESLLVARNCPSLASGSVSRSIARRALDAARASSRTDLPYELVGSPVREATAAGSGAFLDSEPGKAANVVVLDFGAGTIDIAAFRHRKHARTGDISISEYPGSASAITRAGNDLDNCLNRLVLKRMAQLVPSDTSDYKALSYSTVEIRRDRKEQLFREGELSVSLGDGRVVNVTLEEFMAGEGVRELVESIKGELGKAVSACGHNGGIQDRSIRLVLTGGGANLPFLRELGPIDADVGRVRLEPDTAMPDALRRFPNVAPVYSQMAVAIGGAMPDLPQTMTQSRTAHVPSGDRVPVLGGSY